MNQYIKELIKNKQTEKPIDEIFGDVKNKNAEELFDFFVEYFVEVMGFNLFDAGVFAHGYLKDKGINLPFVV